MDRLSRIAKTAVSVNRGPTAIIRNSRGAEGRSGFCGPFQPAIEIARVQKSWA